MKTIAELTTEVKQAQAELNRLRNERANLIESKSPHKIGEIFEQGGRTYRAERITASQTEALVWIYCRYMTAAKTWSLGQKTVACKVEG